MPDLCVALESEEIHVPVRTLRSLVHCRRVEDRRVGEQRETHPALLNRDEAAATGEEETAERQRMRYNTTR
jgi:hypothetical protein